MNTQTALQAVGTGWLVGRCDGIDVWRGSFRKSSYASEYFAVIRADQSAHFGVIRADQSARIALGAL